MHNVYTIPATQHKRKSSDDNHDVQLPGVILYVNMQHMLSPNNAEDMLALTRDPAAFGCAAT